MLLDRSSGLLLHISSLPSRFGVGDLGPAAYQFAETLARSKQKWWQVLPIGPIGFGFSPYSSMSSFAGTPLFISPELLVEDDLLRPSEIDMASSIPRAEIDYPYAIAVKYRLLESAFKRFKSSSQTVYFERFCEIHSYWLDYYAAFVALGEQFGKPWTNWPTAIRSNPDAGLDYAQKRLKSEWEAARFQQFVFDRQWQRLRSYCSSCGIKLIGDIPIYVSHDSADVWVAQDQFDLDKLGNPLSVGGVPPDFFSATGQRWGNPLYRWDVMEQRGYRWWKDRLQRSVELFDLIRLDHFRGFAGYWEIPASEITAERGQWVKGPGVRLFHELAKVKSPLPFIAEDLGVITDDVRELMATLNLPGMAVLQFAFDSGDSNIYLPHNYSDQIVAYTGTHDNNTLMGWLQSVSPNERQFANNYLKLSPGNEHWQAIESLMASRARLVITPGQDLLGLGSEARMNTPGTVGNNWLWRLREEDFITLEKHALPRLRDLTAQHHRSPTNP